MSNPLIAINLRQEASAEPGAGRADNDNVRGRFLMHGHLIPFRAPTQTLLGPRVVRSSALTAVAADAVENTAATSPYIAVYVVGLVTLLGGIAYLFYLDFMTNQRRREAVESRGEMITKLREQGMEKEAQILEAEKVELETRLDETRPKFLWQEVSDAAKRRAESETAASSSTANVVNRSERRAMERQKRREERRKKGAESEP